MSRNSRAPAVWITVLLHLGFALTGIGTVLLGCILPGLAAAGHLRDRNSGLLLMVQFAAAALGALLVRGSYWRTLACGYALICASAFTIVLLRDRVSFTAFGMYGLGLGLAMTSTSMLIGRLYSGRKGAALAILNFSWSAGAMACPLLVARFLHGSNASMAYAPVALMAAPFVLLPLLAANSATIGAETVHYVPHKVGGERRAILYFAALAFLYVGAESSVGNWMTTYAMRTISWDFRQSTLAVSCFWAALLLGRAITPGILVFLTERSLYRASAIAAVFGISLVLAAHNQATLFAGSALTGFALAPLFPLILSLFMTEVGESPNVGWVFATAGMGGAVLSWLTGIISTAAGSLRIGLMVPAAAALAMVLMIFWPGRGQRHELLCRPDASAAAPRA